MSGLSALLVILIVYVLFRAIKRARQIYHICKQLDGPKFVFPGGNIKELSTYEHAGEAFHAWQQKYGPVYRVWMGPFRVIVITIDTGHIKQMLVTDKDLWDIGTRPALRIATGNSLLTSKNPLWQHQRSLMNPAFHFHNLREMTPVFDRYVMKFIEKCEQLVASGDSVDIGEMLSNLTMDIIGSSAFGAELHAQDPKNEAPMYGHIGRILSGPQRFSSMLQQLLPQYVFADYWRRKAAVKSVRANMAKIVRERIKDVDTKAAEEVPRDLLGLLVGCKDEKTGERMPLEQIMDESMAFLLAGHETTSTLMTWLLYALAKSPEVDAKLFDELNEHSEHIKDHPPTHDDIRKLSYLMQTIEETLRKHDPVPALGRKAKQHNNRLGNLFIPRGMLVMINIYGLHRNDGHWPDPLAFKPERFIKNNIGATANDDASSSSSSTPVSSEVKDAIAAASKRDKFSWTPFSHGPRHCIGQEFALLEARSLLSQILIRYKFSLAPNHEDVKGRVGVVLRPAKPIMMTVSRR